MPAFVDRPGAEGAAGERQAERALFPFGMEIRLVLFRRDRTEAHLPAEIVRRRSSRALRASGNRRADHRIAGDEVGKRLLIQPSVPSGRSGMTM